MRIAVLTNYHLDQLGGAEEALDRLATAWQAAGHDVTLLASPRRRPGASRDWRPVYPVVPLVNPWSTRFGLGRYVRPLLVLHRQRPLDVVLASDAYWPGHVAHRFGRQSGVPFCLYSHGSDVMHGSRFLRRAACRRRLERTIAAAAGVACISNYMRQRILEIAAPTGVVQVIPNGWPDEWREPRAPKAKVSDSGQPIGRYVFALGRMVELKGFQTLVEAFALMRRRRADWNEVGLMIAGDGPYREHLVSKAEALGLRPKAALNLMDRRPGDVVFPGTVHGEHKRGLIDGAWVGVCPSIRQEPQGMVVLEMLCRGVPVIASRAGGLPDHIEPGQNGMLFEPGNAAGLAECLESIFASPDSQDAWQRRARQSVAELSWSQVAAAHLELMAQAIALRPDRVGPTRFFDRWWSKANRGLPTSDRQPVRNVQE